MADDGSSELVRRGRRPGGVDAREPILVAAQREFAERGYVSTTIRRVAAAAGVDPKLVHYYFGTKEELFSAAIAAIFRSRGLFEHLQASEGGSPGARYVRAVLVAIEDPSVGPAFMGIIRNLGTHEESRRLFARLVTGEVLGRLAPFLRGESGPARAALAGSHILGLVMARYVLHLEPLASCSIDQVAGLMGPTIDRYVFGGDDECGHERIAGLRTDQ